ncbi:MAG TPA: hypothetical protein VIJ20_05280, partial [Solirubrobacteraceae bacterium]
MRGRRGDRLSGRGRGSPAALVAVIVAAGWAVGALSGSAAADDCVASASTDVYTPTTMVDGVYNWNTSGNWSSASGIPTGSEVACWDNGTTVTVTDGETVDSIQAGGDLDIAGGGTLGLTSSTNSSSIADLALDGGGELDGPATGSQALDITGSFDWGGPDSGGATLSNTGTVAVTAGTVAIDGTTSTPTFDGGSIMSGAVSISGSKFAASGSPTLTSSSTITL